MKRGANTAMWFIFALVTALCWGGADLFYKKSSDPTDNLSQFKTVVMVGLVMGAHAALYLIFKVGSFDPLDMVRYLPVSALYILSMTIGYIGFRYIEISIASPVGNTSGALTALLCFIFFRQALGWNEIAGIIAVTAGILFLAIIEKRAEPPKPGESRYYSGTLAIIFPILYCLIDGLGTFADAIYLDELELIGEDAALLAYEFTFLLAAVAAYIYITAIKKQPFNPFKQGNRAAAALLETAGQYFYVFAMSGRAIVAAPLIASYSIFSVILSSIFLKEKLSRRQYALVALVMTGIALMGLSGD